MEIKALLPGLPTSIVKQVCSERESVCMCVCERERVCVCILCVCVHAYMCLYVLHCQLVKNKTKAKKSNTHCTSNSSAL